MSRCHDPIRQRAVQLARLREKAVSRIAEDLGISDSCLRGWMKQADSEEGRREGLSTDDRDELFRWAGRRADCALSRASRHSRR
jgi:transposase-like protein